MSEKALDLIKGTSMPLTGVTPPVKLQSKEAQDAIAPSTTKGSDQGDTPYRLAVIDLENTANNCTVLTVKRPNPRMAGVGADGGAENAQEFESPPDSPVNAFTSRFDYAAWDNHNWIVELNGIVLTHDATPADLSEFKVEDDGGKAKFTIGDGDPLPKGRIAIINATPLKETLVASGANTKVRKIVNPKDYVYIESDDDANIVLANLEFFYR